MITIKDFSRILDNADIRIRLFEDIDGECFWEGTADDLVKMDRFDNWTITLIDVSSIGCGEVVSLEVVE